MARLKYKATQANRLPNSRKKWWILAVVLLVIAIMAGLELTNTTHIFHKGVPKTKQITQAGTPTEPIPQSTPVTPATPQDKASNTTQGGGNQGGATDTSGQTAADSNDPSKWVVAKSGNITVKQPLANAKIKSGSSLIGSAKVGQVQYRLIDNKVGVLAQGTLSVVNGNFSGNMQFQPSGTGGRLDVFSTETDGSEINEVQIAVSF